MEFWSFFEAEIMSREQSPRLDLLTAIATEKSEIDAPSPWQKKSVSAHS